jgi:long-chain acyl-CoA synthetase
LTRTGGRAYARRAAAQSVKLLEREIAMEFVPKFVTIVDLFEESVEKFAARDLFGTKKDGVWTWVSYAQVKRQVDAFRAGLASHGIGAGSRVSIISNNRVQWAVASFASLGLGAVFVPMYEAQLEKDWEFILKDCEASLLIVSTDDIYAKTKDFPSKIPSLKTVLSMAAPATEPHAFERLVETYVDKPLAPIKPSKDDTAFLIYTSGTTGNPKGVILTHENIASNVSAVHQIFDLMADDRSLSFLPWAHSFGLTCELHTLLSMGAAIAINSAVDKLIEELPEVRPTVLMSVPRIFNRIYDGVHKQISKKPGPIQSLFKSGLRLSAKKRDGQPLGLGERITLGLADKLVFDKIRGRFGGRMRYAISGGAALAKQVAEFIDSLGIMVYEGYGLTETSPITNANAPNNRKIGSVGKAIPGCRIVIDRAVTGDPLHGEIIAYGPNIMKGYHNRPEENAAVLMSDGGFRTGDMGYVDDDGYLYITGRIKEQYKLENGKYVVPSPLEELLKLSPFVANVYVHGANKPHNVALVVPDFEVLKGWAAEQGIKADTDEQLIASPQVLEKMRVELDAASKGFKGYEKVEKIGLLTDDFTTANGMLTPSLKLKRRTVIERYGDKIEALYA